jgi:hypothetical protein
VGVGKVRVALAGGGMEWDGGSFNIVLGQIKE